MIIFGVDPGFAITGYGVIEYKNNKFKTIDYGVITTDAKTDMHQRLYFINDKLQELLVQYKPDVMSVEELFFNTNIKTAIAVGHGRGVVLLTAAKAGIPVFEYTPLQVKQSVVGYGRAKRNRYSIWSRFFYRWTAYPSPMMRPMRLLLPYAMTIAAEWATGSGSDSIKSKFQHQLS